MKKVLSFILCLCVIASVLSVTGCTGTTRMPEKRIVDHVYKLTECTKPQSNMYYENMTMVKGKVYYTVVTYDDDWNSHYTLNIFDPETGSVSVAAENLPFYDRYEEDMYCQGLYFTDGGIYAFMNRWSWDEETGTSMTERFLEVYDYEMNLQKTIDINKALGSEEDSGYISSSCVVNNGNFIAFYEDAVTILDSDGNYMTGSAIDLGPQYDYAYITNVVPKGNQIFAIYEGFSSAADYSYTYGYLTVDGATGEVSEVKDIPAEFYDVIYNISSDPNGNLYASGTNGVYMVDFESGEKTEVLNWLNSDLSANAVYNLVFIDENTIVGLAQDEDTYNTYLAKLVRIPDDQVVPKYVLTLAGENINSVVRNAVLRFNRTNDEYRIEIKDYSSNFDGMVYYAVDEAKVGGGYNGGSGSETTTLKDDILSGNIPDILMVSSDFDITGYAKKGLFANIYDYLNNDPDFKKEEYLYNIFEAYEINGKLYELCPTFSFNSIGVKKALVDGKTGWNMAEFREFIGRYPDSYISLDLSRNSFFNAMITCDYDLFVDRSTGKCNFDCEEFSNILQAAKDMPVNTVYDDYYAAQEVNGWEYDPDFWNEIDRAYREDRALLATTSVSEFTTILGLNTYTFYEDVTLIGYPCDDKAGNVVSEYTTTFSISNKSPLKEGAWQFLKYLLSDSYQQIVVDNWGGFPVKLSALELKAEREKQYDYGSWEDIAIEEEPEIESEDVEVVEGPAGKIAVGYEQGHTPRYLTDEEVAFVMNILKSIKHVARSNSELLAIISEEAGPYFDGKKSLEDTIKVIQNRATIFVNESR